MNQKKKFIVGLLVLVVVLAAIILLVKKNGGGIGTVDPYAGQIVSTEDPFDIVFDFYSPWKDAVLLAETSPYAKGYQNTEILSKELRARLQASEGKTDAIDPVLCQNTIPQKFTARTVSETDDTIRILVMAKEKELPAQSIFHLRKYNDGWFIEDIECNHGEFDIEREFTFDKEGFLLKDVPEPLNSEFWHIIFEDNGELGHFAPLHFTETSICVESNGSESPCSQDTFTEAAQVHIYGQMTELGVDVAKIEFKE